MTLTTGTALQNGKYVVGSTLERNDVGVTYEATQIHLDQPVFLQTLTAQWFESGNAEELQQQFLKGVRRLIKGQPPYPGRVLDYFVELQMPFIVLEAVPGKEPLRVQDWFSATAPTLEEEPFDSPPSSPFLVTMPLDTPVDANYGSSSATLESQDFTPPSSPAKMDAAEVNPLAAVESSTPPEVVTNTQIGRSPHAKRKNTWVPVSLIMTAVIAGIAGAGGGWVLRFGGLGKTGNHHNPIFDRDQAFPPLGNWPVQEKLEHSEPASNWQPSGGTESFPVRANHPLELPFKHTDHVAPQPDFSVPINPAPSSSPDQPSVANPPATLPPDKPGSSSSGQTPPPADPVPVAPAPVEQPPTDPSKPSQNTNSAPPPPPAPAAPAAPDSTSVQVPESAIQ